MSGDSSAHEQDNPAMKALLPKRRLIPKWRQVRQTLATQEVPGTLIAGSRRSLRADASAPVQPAPSDVRPPRIEEFEQAVHLWREHHEPGILGDIISFWIHAELQQSIVDIGSEAVRRGAVVTPAQHFILSHLAQSNGANEELILQEPEGSFAHHFQPLARPIRDLRGLLRTNPSNPLALLDFAQLQAAIGANAVAERALKTALGLVPNSRLVLRTLARFYVHADDPDRALTLLRRHGRTPSDPWLIASEIALADLANVPSAFLSKGRRMLVDAGKAPPAALTELAGSVAMEELAAGNLKKARELQRVALLNPTDNVAAQAVDQELQFGISLNAPNVAQAIGSSPEAQLLRSWYSQDPELVEESALRWHNQEPFSSRPIQILSTMFAYRGEVKRATNWLTVGLRSDPGDRGLLINLAYVQARQGLVDQARLTILKARRLHHGVVDPYLVATEGLIAYQGGKFDEGDQLYGRAIELFNAPDNRRFNFSTYCVLNQAIVAIELGHPRANEILKRASHEVRERPNPDAVMLLKVASIPGAENLPAEPAQAKQNNQRLTSQWVFDSATNTLTERKGLTAPGAKPILLLDDRDDSKN